MDDRKKINPAKCPRCQQELNFIDAVIGTDPQPGDFCVCSECASINQFDGDLQLIEPSPDTMERLSKLSPDFFTQLVQTQAVIYQSLRQRMYARRSKN